MVRLQHDAGTSRSAGPSSIIGDAATGSKQTAQAALHTLREMFPSCDPAYLAAALASYPPGYGDADKLIARVSHKMCDINHGHWPTVVYRQLRGRQTDDGDKSKGKGKQRSSSAGADVAQLCLDETASRNFALYAHPVSSELARQTWPAVLKADLAITITG